MKTPHPTVRLVLCSCLLAVLPARAANDVLPPVIGSLSLSQTNFNTSASSQTATVTVRLADDLSGVGGAESSSWSPGNASVSFASPSRRQSASVSFSLYNRISGDALDGVYANLMYLPPYAEVGVWILDGITLNDMVGNRRQLGLADCLRQGFPVHFSVEGTPLTNAPSLDIIPPNLLEMSLSRTNVNTSVTNKAIVVTVRLTDDLSGIGPAQSPYAGGAYVTFTGPSRKQYANVSFERGNRLSGGKLDGIYTNTIVLPRYSETGVWTFEWASVSDADGNNRAYSAVDAYRQGFPAQFTVQGTADTNGPCIVSFSLSRTNVAASGADRSIGVTVRLTDDLSGIGLPAWQSGAWSRDYASAVFRGPSGNQSAGVSFSSYNRRSGDEHDGVYANTFVLPLYSEAGVWTLESIVLSDAVYNRTQLNLADCLRRGLPYQFTVDDSPCLGVATSGDMILLSVPPSASGLMLQSRDAFSDSEAWTDLSITASVFGHESVVMFPVTRNGHRFYRLQKDP